MKMYALVTDQGTAASETALCETHYHDENLRAECEKRADKDVIPRSWTDCTGNDVLHCYACG